MITTMQRTIYFWHGDCGHGAGPYDFEEMAQRAERDHKCPSIKEGGGKSQ